MTWVSTTASSTRCWKSDPAERRSWRPWLAALCLLALVLLLLPLRGHAQSHTAEVTQLRLERGDDGVFLSATVKFDLPPSVLEVLDKGIAIHFVAEAELYRERWYWTDQKIAQVARHMRLTYQPLTRRWRLAVSPVPITTAVAGITLNQNFDTLDEALDAVRRIGRLRMGDASEIPDDSPQTVMFRFRLDTSQLPRPFQIGLVGQSDWNVAVERTAKLPVEKLR